MNKYMIIQLFGYGKDFNSIEFGATQVECVKKAVKRAFNQFKPHGAEIIKITAKRDGSYDVTWKNPSDFKGTAIETYQVMFVRPTTLEVQTQWALTH